MTTRDFKCHGVVTQWRYWPARSVPFKAMVLRKVHGSDDTKYNIVGINAIPDGAIDQSLIYQVPDNERISVQIGDVIGFAWNSPAVKYSKNPDAEDVYMIKNIPMTNLKVNDTLVPYKNRTRAYSIQAVISGRLKKINDEWNLEHFILLRLFLREKLLPWNMHLEESTRIVAFIS